MTRGPCMCGSPDCPSCGGAMGTYSGWSDSTPPDVCEACELVPPEPGEYLCKKCAELAAEAAHERYVNDGETFRGREREAFEAEQMEKIQRELKR